MPTSELSELFFFFFHFRAAWVICKSILGSMSTVSHFANEKQPTL